MSDNDAQITGSIPASKTCGRCGESKSNSEFNHNRQSADGLQNWCTACHREYRRERAEKKASVDKLVTRQKDAGGNWAAGHGEEYDKLAAHVLHLRTTKHESLKGVSEELDIPYRTICRLQAHAQRQLVQGDLREQFRHLVVAQLEEIGQAAFEEGDWGEARKAAMDIGKVVGIVSTGGNAPGALNVGVQVNNTPERVREVEEAAVRYLERRQEELGGGELVEAMESAEGTS